MFRLFLVLHVLGAVIALGFSLSYGIWTALADATGPSERAFALRSISWIDRHATTPAYVWQAVTGIVLVALIDWSVLKQSWLEISIGLYVLLTVLALSRFAPLHRRQTALAERLATGEPVEAEYRSAAAHALTWGVAVTLLTLAIVILMVTRPIWW
jgi:uncharacterized membrane protein